MLRFKQYYKVQSLEEAYELNQKKANHILGGMLWLRLQNRTVGGVIDLSDLGLDKIEETEDEFIIGAMVTLRQLERDSQLKAYLGDAVHESVCHIVGVQFRNLATVGGSIYGRFGFSDVLTLFLALGAKVKLYKAGEMSLEEYSLMKKDNDIVEAIILPKKVEGCAYQCIRNSQTDFPVLTCCGAKVDGSYRVSIGARPGQAVLVTDENGILSEGLQEESIKAFGSYVREQVETGSNYRASAEYRSKMVEVLTKRVFKMIKEGGVI